MFKRVREQMSIKLEQFRQAHSIHGGLLGLSLAKLAVKLSRLSIPSAQLRLRLFRDVYAKRYPPGLNAEEAEKPLEAYRSLNAVFTRGLKPQCRPIGAGGRETVSPCDGAVQDVGRVERGRLYTVKGIEYSLGSLLPNIDTEPYLGGQFTIIFLSPIDCHRVFCPQDACLREVVHVPGARLLVHPPFQRPEYPVYTLNERMIFLLASELGSCALVMVAGWGVGNITLPFAADFRPRSKRIESLSLGSPHFVKRGDWIATFELGSSVVLLTSASLGATPLVRPHEKVQYGQPVLTVAGVNNPHPRGE
jgi:phosphatidylserine decarboxylase